MDKVFHCLTKLFRKASFFLVTWLLLLFFLLLPLFPASALESALSIRSRLGQLSRDPRMLRFFWNRFRYEASQEVYASCYAEGAYELLTYWLEDGRKLRDGVSVKNTSSRIYRLDDPQHRLVGEKKQTSGEETMLEQDLDRLLLACQFDSWDVTLGRQAIAFGATQSVNPSDIFAQVFFKPLDGEFRPGSDAVRLRSWLSDTSELDFGALAGFEGKPGHNGAYVRIHMLIGEAYVTSMGAAFGRNRLAGLSLQSSLGYWGIVFDGAWVLSGEKKTELPKEQEKSWLPWTLGINRQLTGDIFFSLEYHRNAMGTEDPEQYTTNSLQPIYTHYPVTLKGKDYLMTSMQYQLTPLWSLGLSSIYNRNEGSSVILPELEWNLAEDWWLNGGGSISEGNSEAGKTEFGALPEQYTLTLRHYR